MSRPPSPPPELPGFTYVEPLGTGGFADVFLYEQQMPRRRVAVKVLLADRIASGSAQEFTDEANVMAMLSTHPAIVTIYQAGVAGDGRPYLVMEYCPRPNLQLRARKEAFSVAEALRVGIQVAGAVETAHRAGVLHRDIKPANILVTEYNRPALTDFGIASTTGAITEATGMSIPWSPPESFGDPPQSGTRSDVWALGATLYTLLARRSPFERPGERNSSADLIERIERAPLPPIGRPDSPASLQRVLERAMAKNPADRYPSAVAFARALQKVQIELSHSVTPIDIVDDHPIEQIEDDDDGLTRVREVVSIDPDAGSTRPSALTQPFAAGPLGTPAPTPASEIPVFDLPSAGTAAVDETVIRPPSGAAAPAAGADDDRTLLRPPRVLNPASPAPAAPSAAAPEAAVDAEQKPRRRIGLVIGGIAAAVVIIAGGVAGITLAANSLNAAPEPEETTDVVDPQDVVGSIIPQVTDLAGERSGSEVTFTWANPDEQDGDYYIWQQVVLSGETSSEKAQEPTVTFTPEGEGEVCIDVTLVRTGGRSSEPVRGCID
ncbi:serine/threonine-protein kinase [Microbacterium sp. CIAB417]|uniref:serine/threonine-protein kinase n=1 Tax=Microbacterium sp. CIAB417 TaxID=2860287 RepID=UPI001FAB6EB3|nr:serine/threonine-protein kinase [Microbacterium sp. CIAB417]